ncbi:unnamed protein product [Adineta ricciae]|uniref:Uncharacterized protein n=1 Tax=Adineta ricciae TaxID=249248 RepID=A0A813YAF6_ADIRI|nr:unnamed protein product [Adineta ricciae]CAF1402022.1 unnamed protein product [Adineta ricciae]
MNVIHHRESYERELPLILGNDDYEQSNTKLNCCVNNAEEVQANDLILFYYSGNVHQTNEECYLIPIQNQHLTNGEAIPDLAIPLETIVRRLSNEKKQPFALIFILD